MGRISPPGDGVLVIGRVRVKNDADPATACAPSKRITLTPLEPRQEG